VREEIPYGLLDLLILRTLARVKQMHGFEIADQIRTLSQDALRVEEGSLYPDGSDPFIPIGKATSSKNGPTASSRISIPASGRTSLMPLQRPLVRVVNTDASEPGD
jgi:hypothetical protein